MSIRSANTSDIPALLDLIEFYFHPESSWQTIPFCRKSTEQTFNHFIANNNNSILLVAQEDELIVGFAICFMNRYWFSNENYASDLSFYVRNDYRKGYVGVSLIRAMKKFALSKGVKELFITVNSGIHVERTEKLIKCLGGTRLGFSMSINLSK